MKVGGVGVKKSDTHMLQRLHICQIVGPARLQTATRLQGVGKHWCVMVGGRNTVLLGCAHAKLGICVNGRTQDGNVCSRKCYVYHDYVVHNKKL